MIRSLNNKPFSSAGRNCPPRSSREGWDHLRLWRYPRGRGSWCWSWTLPWWMWCHLLTLYFCWVNWHNLKLREILWVLFRYLWVLFRYLLHHVKSTRSGYIITAQKLSRKPEAAFLMSPPLTDAGSRGQGDLTGFVLWVTKRHCNLIWKEELLATIT